MFISYASADTDMVVPIVTAIERAGISVWFDQSDLRPLNDNITARIREGIRSTAMTLVCLSPTYTQRPACRFELLRSLQSGSGSDGMSRLVIVELPGTDAGPDQVPWSFLSENVRFRAPGVEPHRLADLVEHLLRELRGRQPRGPARTTEHWWPGRAGRIQPLAPRFELLLATFDKLMPHLGDDRAQQLVPPPVQLVGMAGTGKTMLSLSFATHFESLFTGGIVRLDASGGGQGPEFRAEQVVASVADQNLQWARDMVADGRVPGPELDDITTALAADLLGERASDRRRISALAARVQRALGEPVLWILDDLAPGLGKSQLDSLLCPDPALGRTLITSKRGCGLPPESTVAVGGVTDQEALQILTREWPGELTDQAQQPLARLAEQVGNHPLALDVLSARLKDSAAAELLTELTGREQLAVALEQQASLLKHEGVKLPTEHAPSILLTLADSIQELAADPYLSAGVVALRLASLLPAGTEISKPLLAAVFDREPSPVSAVFQGLSMANLARVESASDASGGQTRVLRVHALVAAVVTLPELADGAAGCWTTPSEQELRLRAARWWYQHAEGQDVVARSRDRAIVWDLLRPILADLTEPDRLIAAKALYQKLQLQMRYPTMDRPAADQRRILNQLADEARHAANLAAGSGRDQQLVRARAAAMQGLLLTSLVDLIDDDQAQDTLGQARALLAESLATRTRLLDPSDPADADELDRARFNLGRPGLRGAQLHATRDPGAVTGWLDTAELHYRQVGENRQRSLPRITHDELVPEPIREQYEATASCYRGLAYVAFLRAVLSPGLDRQRRLAWLSEADRQVHRASELTSQVAPDDELSADMRKDRKAWTKNACARAILEGRDLPASGDPAAIAEFEERDLPVLLLRIRQAEEGTR